MSAVQRPAVDEHCDHGTPVGSFCGLCTALVTGIPRARFITDLRRGERVVYLGDDAHRGLEGEVTRVGLTVLDEPAVEVVFGRSPGINGNRRMRKQIRVSRLARAESQEVVAS